MTPTFKDFTDRFQALAIKRPDLITNTLSNIFTMRIIGNKTHGDMAEIGIAEFIDQFMDDYDSKHVGKDLFRAKEHEEDIVVIDKLTKTEIPISLKAYGDGPLQLSTDKETKMFPELLTRGEDITDPALPEPVLETYIPVLPPPSKRTAVTHPNSIRAFATSLRVKERLDKPVLPPSEVKNT